MATKGKVTHYYDKIGVGVVKLEGGSLKVGDEVKVDDHGKEFTQKVESLQLNHEPVEVGKPGDDVALKLDQPVKPGATIESI